MRQIIRIITTLSTTLCAKTQAKKPFLAIMSQKWRIKWHAIRHSSGAHLHLAGHLGDMPRKARLALRADGLAAEKAVELVEVKWTIRICFILGFLSEDQVSIQTY